MAKGKLITTLRNAVNRLQAKRDRVEMDAVAKLLAVAGARNVGGRKKATRRGARKRR